MLFIGEVLNTRAYKATRRAVEKRDGEAVLKIATEQVDYGADVLDVHAPDLDDQKWILGILKDVDCPLCLDNPDPEILKQCMDSPGVTHLNSISCDRLDLFEQARELDIEVIGLIHNCSAEQILDAALKYGFPKERLFLDPAVFPVSVDPTAPKKLVESHREIKRTYDVRTVAGIGNVSFGMPRPVELKVALILDLYKDGLDAAIMNVKELAWFIRASDALRDPTGKAMMDYVKTFKNETGGK